MNCRWLGKLCLALACALAAPEAQPQLITKKALSLDAARTMAAAAEAYARKNNWSVTLAILDDGGHLLYFQRMDGVNIGAIEVCLRKAESAVKFKRAGKAFADRIAGEPQVMVIPGAFPFEGGLPIVAGGEVIGGIGVSGATAAQDAMIAQAGVDALAKLVGK
ncbi:MAG: heme-binding protein [Bryobacterales bacterium]|nr:heme-binding protein [Bryobacterales bacterium]